MSLKPGFFYWGVEGEVGDKEGWQGIGMTHELLTRRDGLILKLKAGSGVHPETS